MITKESILGLLDVAHEYICNVEDKNQYYNHQDCSVAHLTIDALKVAVDNVIHNNF